MIIRASDARTAVAMHNAHAASVCISQGRVAECACAHQVPGTAVLLYMYLGMLQCVTIVMTTLNAMLGVGFSK